MDIKKDETAVDASPRDNDVARGELESVRPELITLKESGDNLVFEAQAALVNHAVQKMGMGKYQWGLFVLAGYGWLCDQLWQTTVSDALPQVGVEFTPQHSAFLSLALIAGLVCGAGFWGFGADLIGRRLVFNTTLFIAGVFGIAAGAANSFVCCAVLCAFIGFGVGGNLPVDGAIFLEFLPASHQYLLEILSVWWSIGQVIPAVTAWGFLPNFSCSADTPVGQCKKADNMGWRYLMYTMGSFTMVLWIIRFFFFRLRESPKYLIGQGRYQEAIDVLNSVATFNGITQPLTLNDLEQVERDFSITHEVTPVDRRTAVKRAITTSLKPTGFPHVKALFATPKLAYSMSLIILIWGMIGLASPLYSNFLPEYLATKGAEAGSTSVAITYRNNLIIIVCSIPGTLIGGWLINIKHIGRKGTLGGALIVSAIFLFAFTAARNQAQILAFNCVATFVQYIMWGALYCYTPEVIPSVHRGTGTGIAAAFNRICGLMAPIIATYVGFTSVPVFVSASLYMAAGFLSFALPFEPMGKASL
ncbi:MFS general substrate transporter [Rhizodiscina lignyota]|uniref:MFS general substrate transporter n=1 Tax=Rhizodiscina lignyota TaxID=1504668 RepID=A0A9P4IAP2_9PEZI|nr:MFS general substrate transporter [Rhizodiscina lignyota]